MYLAGTSGHLYKIYAYTLYCHTYCYDIHVSYFPPPHHAGHYTTLVSLHNWRWHTCAVQGVGFAALLSTVSRV